ncbi:MAG: glutamate--tRNA ligase [Bacilli bacterium]
MTNKDLASLIYPDVTKTIEDYERIYPQRQLKEGAIVTRFAPSPTGFVHLGSLRTSFIAKKVSEDTCGIFYLRIEDTDEKRSIENSVQGIIDDLTNFNINIDEGVTSQIEEKGIYGPYTQTKRQEIYDTFAYYLIENDFAYPCFCTEEELENIRKRQEVRKDRIGYYGDYAKYRNISNDEKASLIKKNIPYVIRLKSHGDFEKKVSFIDAVRGKIEFPENDMDTILIKSDKIPVYHFAHVVDDHLMRTTHIIRGEEWISSTPVHIELFNAFNFPIPIFCHLGLIMKIDENGIRRKLSKRKDPEAAVSFYHKEGYPVEALKLYLMTISNSNFEIWMEDNPNKSINDFKFDFKKISESGTLFDINKLINISKVYISKLSANTLYDDILLYNKEYDKDFYELLKNNKEYTISLLNIERNIPRPRKDISCYKDFKKELGFMYDELFLSHDFILKDFYSYEILEDYVKNYYNIEDDKDLWFSKIKELGIKYNFCTDNKAYKEDPSLYKGNISSLCELIRVAFTSRTNTPDLYEILKLLNIDTINKRLQMFKEYMNK